MSHDITTEMKDLMKFFQTLTDVKLTIKKNTPDRIFVKGYSSVLAFGNYYTPNTFIWGSMSGSFSVTDPTIKEDLAKAIEASKNFYKK